MKNLKKIISLVLTLCLTAALAAGCGSQSAPAATEAPENTAAADAVTEATKEAAETAEVTEATAEGTPRMVGDVVIPTQEEALEQLGLDKIPQKVLCTSYNTSMMAYTLGIEITATVDTKRPFPDELRALPNIGIVTGSTTFDFEQIISLSGDLVLGDSFFKSKLEPTLTEQGIKSYFVDAGTYKGMQEAVALIGPAFGKTDEAVKLIEQWQEIAATASAETADLEHPTILCMTKGLMFTENSYVGSLFDILHIENATNSMGFPQDCPPYIPPEVEKILAADPDIILIQGGNKGQQEEFINELNTSETWASLKAVKNGKVIGIDGNLFGMLATMECGEALVELQQIVYGN